MSTPPALAAADTASLRRFERLYRAIPLVSAFLWLCVLYAWETRGHVTPWLFTDETQLTQISRSIAETGHPARRGEPYGFQTLYAYVMAPFWLINDVGTAYAAIKYLGVVVMTSAIFPAYFLARMLVGRPAALFAAVATVATPALAYSSFLLEEPAAYPTAALCFFLIAKALTERTRWWILGAAAACAVAPLVRGQLALLLVVFLVAALLLAWTGKRARRWRATWSVSDWASGAVLLIGAIILLSAVLGSRSTTWFVATGYYRHRMIEYGLWAAGAFTIGLGVLPVVAGLAALARPPGEQWAPALKSVVALTVAAVFCFGLYTAVKASYLSTVFATRVEERNLIYLAPLLFVATALWLERPRLRPVAVAAAAGFVLYVLIATPYQTQFRLYSDALGLSILQMANRNLAFTENDAQWLMLAVLGISVALLFAPRLLGRRRYATGGVLVVAAGLVLAWNLAGQISAGTSANVFAKNLLGNFPTPPNWLDRETDGKDALYLGQKIVDPQGIWLMEFWNRSLKNVWSLDGTAPGPGRTLTPDIVGTHGKLYPDPVGVEYAVADEGVDIVGSFRFRPQVRRVITKDEFGFDIHRVVTRPSQWRVLRLEHPLRLESAPVGIYSDGWTGGFSSYSQFSTPGNRPGFVVVTVSRSGWRGQDRPGHVTIRVGRLIRGKDKQPAMGRVTAVRRWVVHSGATRRFFIPASPPARVEVRIAPTFSPHDFGSSDRRELGAQVSYRFTFDAPR